MKVLGFEPRVSSISTPGTPHRLASHQSSAVLLPTQRSWLQNSVAQAGQSDVRPPLGRMQRSAHKLLPPHQAQADIPHAPTKPSDAVGRPVLLNPTTTQEKITHTLWFQPHNPNLSAQDIRVHVHNVFNKKNDFKDVLAQQITHQVPVAQLIEAVAGSHPTLTRGYIEEQLAALGFPSPEKWLQSVDESTVMHARRKLNQLGLENLDGSGVKVRVVEPNDAAHSHMVTAIIDHPDFGLAPKAAVEKIYPPEVPSGEHFAEKLQGDSAFRDTAERLALRIERGTTQAELIDQLIDEVTPHALKNFEFIQGDVIEQIKAFTASDDQILNLSVSRGFPSALAAFNGWAQAVVDMSKALVPTTSGGAAPSVDSVKQKIASLILSPFIEGPGSPAHRAYVAATQAAARKGKIIVVSAGNSQEALFEIARRAKRPIPDSLAFNPYGTSEYVIVVGASKPNGTPLDVRDDTMAKFSSHGGTRYGVTTTTQGYNVAVPYPLFVEGKGGVHGTSFSAPTVVGLVALYKQVYPNSNVQEIKDFLAKHSVKVAEPEAAQGAGMLDLLSAALKIGDDYNGIQPREAK